MYVHKLPPLSIRIGFEGPKDSLPTLYVIHVSIRISEFMREFPVSIKFYSRR